MALCLQILACFSSFKKLYLTNEQKGIKKNPFTVNWRNLRCNGQMPLKINLIGALAYERWHLASFFRTLKMMPSGVGGRICLGYVLAMLHLEHFVANLVWNFKWMAAARDDTDQSKKQGFTVVMKKPLKHTSQMMKKSQGL